MRFWLPIGYQSENSESLKSLLKVVIVDGADERTRTY